MLRCIKYQRMLYYFLSLAFFFSTPALGAVINPPSNFQRVYQVNAVCDGLTDDNAAIVNGINACVAGNGGRVVLPAGTCVNGSSITLSNFNNCTLEGAGREATIIDCSSLTSTDCIKSSTTINYGYAIRNLTFKGATSGGDTPNILKVRYTDRNVTIDNVGFNVITGNAIYANGTSNLKIKNSIFYGDGDIQSATENPRALRVDMGATNVSLDSSVIEYVKDGVYAVGSSTIPVTNLNITNNIFDNGGFTQKARYTRSGAGVTFSSTTLVDTSGNFTVDSVGANTMIRLLPTIVAGTFSSSPSGAQVIDATANFPSTVLRGDLIRTSTAFAIVEKRVSATTLATSEWRSLSTYRPVAAPVNGTSYTLYKTVLGETDRATNTGTTINVYRWYDMAGETVTPTSGDLYEVSWLRNGYGVKTTAGVLDTTITGNTYLRQANSANELSGLVSTFANNKCIDGLDGCIGIDGGGRASILGNLCYHTKFCVALYEGSTGDGHRNVVQGNVCREGRWTYHGASPTYSGFCVNIRSSDENIVSNNILEKGSIVTGSVAYGIFLDDNNVIAGTDNATNNTISNNVCFGFDTACIRLEGATAVGTNIMNSGTISDGGSSGSLVNGQALTDSPGTCNAAATGRSYWDLSLHEPCVCNGSGWVQNDGGGAC